MLAKRRLPFSFNSIDSSFFILAKLRTTSKNQNFLSKLYKFELLSLQQQQKPTIETKI